MTTSYTNQQISEVFGDSQIAEAAFHFEVPQLYIDQTTPITLQTRLRNRAGFPIANLDTALYRELEIYQNGFRLPAFTPAGQLGCFRFLATPQQFNRFKVRFQQFVYEQDAEATAAWQANEDCEMSGAQCTALSQTWAVLYESLGRLRRVAVRCNRDCQFGVQMSNGILGLCSCARLSVALDGGTLRWSSGAADGEAQVEEGARLCVKLKKDRTAEIVPPE